MSRRGLHLRPVRWRGFTLIEAVVVVVLLGIAVPPALSLMGSAADGRADAVNAQRAATLASAVLEQVMADAASPAPGLGRGAVAQPGYAAGLAERVDPVTAGYAGAGLSWGLEVGAPAGPLGAATGDASADVFRVVTVRIAYPLARGGRIEMPVSALLPTGEGS